MIWYIEVERRSYINVQTGDFLKQNCDDEFTLIYRWHKRFTVEHLIQSEMKGAGCPLNYYKRFDVSSVKVASPLRDNLAV